jgi:tetratricopeptide (TPR) repeat protein
MVHSASPLSFFLEHPLRLEAMLALGLLTVALGVVGAGCSKKGDGSHAQHADAGPAENAGPTLRDDVAPAAASAYNEAVALLEQRRYKEASDRFQAALEQSPGSLPLLLGWAIASYFQGGNLESARLALEGLVEQRTDLAQPAYVLGHVLMKETRFDQALTAFRSAQQRLGGHYSVTYSLGLAAREAGRLEEAIAYFRKAAEQEPMLVAAWYSLGQTLLQAGREEEGSRALRRFEETKEELWAELFEFRYRGMGPLMLVPELAPDDGTHTGTRPPRMSRLPSKSGSPLGASAPVLPDFDLAGHAGDIEWLSDHAFCAVAAGAVLLDAEGDGDLDLFEIRCAAGGESPGSRLLLWENGAFKVAANSGIVPRPLGMGGAAGDLDDDGDADLVLTYADGVQVFENLGAGRFEEIAARWGVAAAGWCTGAALVDFDQDGDLDIHVSRLVDPGRVVDREGSFPGAFGPLSDLLFENQGERRFRDVSAASGLGAEPLGSLGALWLDLDGDSAVDVVQGHVDGAARVMMNGRNGTFAEPEDHRLPLSSRPDHMVAGTALDLTGDGRLDLALTRWERPALEVLVDDGRGRFRSLAWPPEAARALPAGPAYGLAGADLSGTGRPGLVFLAGGRLLALEVGGGDGPAVIPLDLGGGAEVGFPARGLLVADLDRNGTEDLALGSARGLEVFLNTRNPDQAFLRVRLVGQFGSNRSGLGAVIDARTGPVWQVRVAGANAGYMSGGVAETTFSFRGLPFVELLRVAWPSGIRQPLVNLRAGREVELREKGLKSSCPLLFAWDGTAYRFVSDLLGASSLGLEVSPGVGVLPDHDELIVLPDPLPADFAGRMKLRLVEHLEEILLTDHVRLLAVDHRRGIEAVARERYQFLPPRDETGLVPLANLSAPAYAQDENGNNVLEALLERDGRPVETFEQARPGFAEPHWLELGLGRAEPGRPLYLVLDGWVRYASIEEMAAAARAGLVPQGPAVDVQVEDGTWQTVLEDVGYPAGLPKVMLLDLTGKLRAAEQKVRIRTNLLVYWDRIRVARNPLDASLTVRALALERGTLWRSGYPLATRGGDGEPLAFDGNHFRPARDFAVAKGNYTALGEVTPLLGTQDNRLVIQSHGEALDLVFDARQLPPVPEGQARTFAVLVGGWIKDQEPGTLTGPTVAPIPWREMTSYPPAAGERPPDWEDLRRDREVWNTRPLP